MTNKLEKTFFDTFGIGKRQVDCKQPVRLDCEDCKTCEYSVYDYPEITDRILLELICILGNINYFLIADEGLPIDIDGLKKSVLHSLTLQARFNKNKHLKQQVRALFEKE